MTNDRIIQAWSEIRPDTACDRRMLSNILEKNQEKNSAGALYRNNKKWIPILAGSAILLAAGLILAFRLGWFSKRSYTDSTVEENLDNDTPEGIHIPAIILPDPETAATADMIQLVVWQGNIYTYAGICYDPDIIKALQGDYLGEANGSIDEWSTPSDYEQYLAGTFIGDVYTVKGYDPTFRLCSIMSWEDENGAERQMMSFLDHLNGITISKGSDYYEDRLKISGRVMALSWQFHQDWDKTGYNQQPDSLHQLDQDANGALWRSFLSEIDQAQFIDISTDSAFMKNLYNESVQTHLFITLNDGTVTELRLFKGGYVGCSALGNYFVRIPGTTFDEMYRKCTGE